MEIHLEFGQTNNFPVNKKRQNTEKTEQFSFLAPWRVSVNFHHSFWCLITRAVKVVRGGRGKKL